MAPSICASTIGLPGSRYLEISPSPASGQTVVLPHYGGGISLPPSKFLEALFFDEPIVNRDILNGMEKGYFHTNFSVLPEV